MDRLARVYRLLAEEASPEEWAARFAAARAERAPRTAAGPAAAVSEPPAGPPDHAPDGRRVGPLQQWLLLSRRSVDVMVRNRLTLAVLLGSPALVTTMMAVLLRGDKAHAEPLIEGTIDDVSRRGEGVGINFAEWANALLHNGLGSYDKALAAAQRATAYEADPGTSIWPTVELIEAGVRTGATEAATSAYRRLSEMTSASGTDWALGLRARSHALLSEGEEAEDHHRESIARLGRTRVRTDLARAHLLYGEWLRRQRARTDARDQLRTAHRMFEAMGMDAFAERARRELQVSGVTVQKRATATRHAELTAQEAQVARLARDGLTNPEIGIRLFISTHTVQYHLRKVFVKLGIESRSQLGRVLPRDPDSVHRPRQAAPASPP